MADPVTKIQSLQVPGKCFKNSPFSFNHTIIRCGNANIVPLEPQKSLSLRTLYTSCIGHTPNAWSKVQLVYWYFQKFTMYLYHILSERPINLAIIEIPAQKNLLKVLALPNRKNC